MQGNRSSVSSYNDLYIASVLALIHTRSCKTVIQHCIAKCIKPTVESLKLKLKPVILI